MALRVLADHARTMSFMISDGVFPSNEDRGYVLRRIIRRAVLRASLLGTSRLVCPGMVEAVVEVMGDAYPDLAKNADFVSGVATREEERFRSNLRSGMALLEAELAAGPVIGGETAFKLHDTHGFPIDLTRGATGRGATVDDAGFASAMDHQRVRSREAAKGQSGVDNANLGAYRELVEQFGPTTFIGYESLDGVARVLAVIDGETGTDGEPGGEVEIFLDRTPFYAEAGGQIGDPASFPRPRAGRRYSTRRPPSRASTATSLSWKKALSRQAKKLVAWWTPNGGRLSGATTPALICSTGPCAKCWASM